MSRGLGARRSLPRRRNKGAKKYRRSYGYRREGCEDRGVVVLARGCKQGAQGLAQIGCAIAALVLLVPILFLLAALFGGFATR